MPPQRPWHKPKGNGQQPPSTPMEFALNYAQRGWYVFPAPPGKKKGLLSATISNGNPWGCTKDIAEVQTYWTRWPSAGIGIATGPQSKVLVLEADTPKGHAKDGIASLHRLEEEHGALPPTLMCESPSGSLHYYFNYPAAVEIRNSESKIAEGVDIRAKGGMVIAPPSTRNDGAYKWLNDNPIADAPLWLIEAACSVRVEMESPDLDEPIVDLSELARAMEVIPHKDNSWGTWNRIGMALWSASGGRAFDLFDTWSKKWHGYSAKNTRERWAAIGKSPPTELSVATIFYEADLASPNWRVKVIARPMAILIKPGKPRALRWLWNGHLPRGSLELMTGVTGLGKSQIQVGFVASITNPDVSWPNGERNFIAQNVIMVTAEDSIDDVLTPRLIAAGADVDNRVQFLKCIHKKGKDEYFMLGEDLIALEYAVKQWGDVGLICLDPITAFIGSGSKTDSHKATDVRYHLSPLKDFAERVGICVSAITHPAKATSQRAIDHFIGSQAFIAAARVGHLVTPQVHTDPETGKKEEIEGHLILSMPKNNVGIKMPSLLYHLEQKEIGIDDETNVPIIGSYAICDGESSLTANEAVAEAAGDISSAQRAIRSAENFLAERLANGPVESSIIKRELRAMGCTDYSIQKAQELFVVVSRTETFPAKTVWSLVGQFTKP